MIILGTNSIKETGFNVDNSCRFDGSSSYLQKTYANGQNKTFSISTWVKRSELGDAGAIWSSYHNATNYLTLAFKDDDALRFQNVSAGVNMNFTTNRLFRDVSAWMHILAIVDTTDGTAGDRQQIFINGVRETSFSTSNAYALNAAAELGATDKENIVGRHGSGADYFDGYMAEHFFIDGLALAPTSFGEFDEDSGIWKPIDVSGLTFGTNGYYLDFKDSANLGNDANGGTDLTESGLAAIDQSTDTCTNNFATLNPLNVNPSSAGDTFSEGNLKLATNSNSNSAGSTATMAFTKGKWYAEVKYTSATAWNGVMPTDATINGDTGRINWYQGRTLYLSGSNTANWGSVVSAGDIVGIALDMDNFRVTISQSGQWWGGSSFNQAQPHTFQALISGYDTWTFLCASGSGTSTSEWNFGSPPYAISSGNTDGDGYGNFEYAVPSGYYSLNTKNLAEYG